MNDKEFLQHIWDRLHFVHLENTHVDYMLRLQAIIDAIPEGKQTKTRIPDEVTRVRNAVTGEIKNIQAKGFWYGAVEKQTD